MFLLVLVNIFSHFSFFDIVLKIFEIFDILLCYNFLQFLHFSHFWHFLYIYIYIYFFICSFFFFFQNFASAFLDLVGCVPVLLLWLCPGACLNSVPHTVAQVVPTPPRPDLCLPQTETAATASASLSTVLCVPAPILPENVSRFRIHSLDRSVSWSSGVLDLSCASSAWTQAVLLVFSEVRSYRPRAFLAMDSLPHSRVPGRVLHPPPRCTDASSMTNLSTRVFHLQTSPACFQLWDQPGLFWRLGQGWLESVLLSLRIDRRWLSRQLFLLMFDHCALLTHLRFQLLQPLRKFFNSESSDVPQHPRRLPASVVATTSSATMRGRVIERDFFLCRWWWSDHNAITLKITVAGAHVWTVKQLSGDTILRLKEWQQADYKTGCPTEFNATEFNETNSSNCVSQLVSCQHEISAIFTFFTIFTIFQIFQFLHYFEDFPSNLPQHFLFFPKPFFDPQFFIFTFYFHIFWLFFEKNFIFSFFTFFLFWQFWTFFDFFNNFAYFLIFTFFRFYTFFLLRYTHIPTPLEHSTSPLDDITDTIHIYNSHPQVTPTPTLTLSPTHTFTHTPNTQTSLFFFCFFPFFLKKKFLHVLLVLHVIHVLHFS